MPPTDTFANCIIDEVNFICINKVLTLDISIVKHYVGLTITTLIYRIKVGRVGQLLVVAHHTDNSPSLCYEPELIPDPYVMRFPVSLPGVPISNDDVWIWDQP